MDTSNVLSLLGQLDDEIDDLEESLAPLLKTALSETASKLPLLDKAKLYVLVTYAIESMLFSYLRLHGIKAREHPVFIELTRVKQYFDKIKIAEAPPAVRNMNLDKQAAARFIKAGLAGNDKFDLERAERQAKERAIGHIRFQEASAQIVKKRKVDESEQAPADEDSDSPESDSSSDSSSDEIEAAPEASKKKQKLNEASKQCDHVAMSGTSIPSGPTPKRLSKKQKRKQKNKIKEKQNKKKAGEKPKEKKAKV